MESEFLKRAKGAVLEHLSDEQFGVSELADKVSMSRSNLLRKIKAETSLSASQFIRNIRLEQGLELLKDGAYNVSEVSHKVGFSSTSYFIKCFREQYGYSPGNAQKQQEQEEPVEELPLAENTQSSVKPSVWIPSTIALVLVSVFVVGWYWIKGGSEYEQQSIAVLPFKNDSNDSTNLYLINGLMETTLNNLQKINDLKVVSRTSVEQYRNTTKTVQEITQELPVKYMVEGSGQKVGNRIQVNIQLIETESDRHIWSKQYNREVEDIFELQQEIAKNIVSEIQVVITPEEKALIETIPTSNLEAYDAYLKAREALSKTTEEGIWEAMPYFEKAVELDPEFGSAYAYMAIGYFYLDIYKREKKYVEKVNSMADKALLYSPKAPESLVAKAFYYQQIADYPQTETYLLEAHKYAPGSSDIINWLSDFYTRFSPNSKKYLEFALKGVDLLGSGKDSVTTSYLYLHLSNALIQNGFVDEALKYANKCIDFFPENPYGYIRYYILFVKNGDIEKTRRGLEAEYAKDTNRVDILQEIGKLYYCNNEFDSAYDTYKLFMQIHEQLGLDIYQTEFIKIGDSYIRNGEEEVGRELLKEYKTFADNDISMYQDVHLAAYHAYTDQLDSAEYYMKRFANAKDIQYWIVLFIEEDPVFEDVKDEEWFVDAVNQIKGEFWRNHNKLKLKLMGEGLL